jgi:hypothetical protein
MIYSPSASFRVILKCRSYQFDVVGAFLQDKMRSRVFIKLPIIYGELFQEYDAYCGRTFMPLKAMYGMTISGKYWYEKIRDWLVSVGFIQYDTCPVLFTIHEPYRSFLRIIFYIDDELYFATSEGALHWKGSRRKSQKGSIWIFKEHSIGIYQHEYIKINKKIQWIKQDVQHPL